MKYRISWDRWLQASLCMESSGRRTWHFRGGSYQNITGNITTKKSAHFFIPLPKTNSLPLKMGDPWKLGDPELGFASFAGAFAVGFRGCSRSMINFSLNLMDHPRTWFSGEQPWWSYPKFPRPGVVRPLPNGRPKWHINWGYLPSLKLAVRPWK